MPGVIRVGLRASSYPRSQVQTKSKHRHGNGTCRRYNRKQSCMGCISAPSYISIISISSRFSCLRSEVKWCETHAFISLKTGEQRLWEKAHCVLTCYLFFFVLFSHFASIKQTHSKYKCPLLRCWQMPRVNKTGKTENIMFHLKSSSSIIVPIECVFVHTNNPVILWDTKVCLFKHLHTPDQEKHHSDELEYESSIQTWFLLSLLYICVWIIRCYSLNWALMRM